MSNRPQSLDRSVQPSALHPTPGFHRMDLPPIVLAEVVPGRGGPPQGPAMREQGGPRPLIGDQPSPYVGTVEWTVTTPEVRARIKAALMFLPRYFGTANELVMPGAWWDGAPGHPNFGATALWAAKREEGILGGCGYEPVENLVGDFATPVPIPDNGLMGFLFELETTADEIWGRLTVDATNLFRGAWVLKVAADAVDPMSETEWRRVCGRFARNCLSGLLLPEGTPL